MNRIRRIIAILCCFLLLTGFSTPDVESKVRFQKKADIMNSLREVNIREEKLGLLADKLLRGDVLDSMKEEYQDLPPVFTYTRIDGTYYEEYVYPDGSVKQVRIDPGVFTGTIITGNYQSGSYWWAHTGSRAFATWGVVTASFYADFQGSADHGVIQRVYDYGIIVVGGTFRDVSLTKVRENATSTLPALAQLFFIGSAVGGFGEATFYLRLYVPKARQPFVQLSVMN